MNRASVVIIAIFIFVFPRNSSSNIENGLSGNFSFYFLNQQWIQEFCEERPVACSLSSVSDRKSFTLHGLWPQHSKKEYPSYCSRSPGCKTIKPCDLDWESLTVEVKNFLMDNMPINTIDLAKHEWKKHGTCSGLTQQVYFETAQKVFNILKTKKIILNNIGNYVSYADIQNQYNNSIMAQCDNESDKNYLYSLTSYWRKDGSQLYFDYRKENIPLNNCSNISQIYIRGIPQSHGNKQEVQWVVGVITVCATLITFGVIGAIIGYMIYKKRSTQYEHL